MSLHIEIENAPAPYEDITIIRVNGELTSKDGQSRQFAEKVGAAFERATLWLPVLDMNGVTRIGDDGWKRLAYLSSVVERNRDRAKIFGLKPDIEREFRHRRLDAIEIYGSQSAALQSIRPAEPVRQEFRRAERQIAPPMPAIDWNPALQISKETAPAPYERVTILRPRGMITTANGGSSAMYKAIYDELKNGNNYLLVDMSKAAHIDSSGVGTFMAGYREAEKTDGRLLLFNVSPNVREMVWRNNHDNVPNHSLVAFPFRSPSPENESAALQELCPPPHDVSQQGKIPRLDITGRTASAPYGHVMVLRLNGALLAGNYGANDLDKRLQKEMSTGHRNLLLDMDGVSEIDKEGMRALVDGFIDAYQGGGHLRLFNANKEVVAMLKSANLDGMLGVTYGQYAGSEKVALQAFRAPSVPNAPTKSAPLSAPVVSG